LIQEHPFQITGEVQMSAIANPTQSEQLSKGSLVKKQFVEALTVDPANLKNDQPQSERPWLSKRAALALTLITFCIGVAATSTWQFYSDVAREMIARSSPRLGWLAPQPAPVVRNTPVMIAPAAPAAPSPNQEQLNAMSLDLDAVVQSVDRIATSQEQMTRSVNRIVASQEQMARTIDQLAAGHEQMTREITKLQAIEQYILYKNSEPAPRPAPPTASKPVLRSPKAAIQLTPARNP
jgi:hypothetical protein